MKKIAHLYKIWAGALLFFVHTAILVYWEQPGGDDNRWVSVTMLIFMFLPIGTLIVLIDRGGLSMYLGLIYIFSFSIFVVGLAYFDRALLTQMYLGTLILLWCNDVIRRDMEVEQHHFSAP